MTREKQDKLWAELPEKKQKEYKERYNSYINSIKTETHLSNYEWGIKEGEIKILIDTFGEHNLKSKTLTYEDVARELFLDKKYWIYSSANNSIQRDVLPINRPINSTSKEQIEKLLAINKLLNVAKFLNKNEDGSDWVLTIEDWDNINQDDFYTLGIDPADNEVHVIAVNKLRFATEIVYFRTEALAEQAVQILGEDVVRTALTTEY